MSLEGEYVPSKSGWVRRQVELFEGSGGVEGNTVLDRPIVVITAVGAQSGHLRKIPVMRVEHDGKYAAVASYGGAPDDPEWVHNLRANPEVELQDGPVRQTYRASAVDGSEREEWWERAVDAFPNYAEYQQKTDREIPVFVLEPIDA